MQKMGLDTYIPPPRPKKKAKRGGSHSTASTPVSAVNVGAGSGTAVGSGGGGNGSNGAVAGSGGRSGGGGAANGAVRGSGYDERLYSSAQQPYAPSMHVTVHAPVGYGGQPGLSAGGSREGANGTSLSLLSSLSTQMLPSNSQSAQTIIAPSHSPQPFTHFDGGVAVNGAAHTNSGGVIYHAHPHSHGPPPPPPSMHYNPHLHPTMLPPPPQPMMPPPPVPTMLPPPHSHIHTHPHPQPSPHHTHLYPPNGTPFSYSSRPPLPIARSHSPAAYSHNGQYAAAAGNSPPHTARYNPATNQVELVARPTAPTMASPQQPHLIHVRPTPTRPSPILHSMDAPVKEEGKEADRVAREGRDRERERERERDEKSKRRREREREREGGGEREGEAVSSGQAS